ncbi:hypothetical protein FJY63_00235, partial [Candidatus Sumerlaeota bacterium]|nr:hypothetical protein [Candidatus Sumerlaeota bacterium]
MNMGIQIGNREKIAALAIVCLVAIAAVHYFLIMGKAASYRNTYNDYMGKRQEWGLMVNPQSSDAIDEF